MDDSFTPKQAYCPKCNAKHKFGMNNISIDCYRCFTEFEPRIHEKSKYLELDDNGKVKE